MDRLHYQRLTRIWTQTRIRDLMATLYCTEHVHIAQTQSRIPTPYFCVGQESRVRVRTR